MTRIRIEPLLALVVLALIATAGIAQDPIHRRYTTDDGLASNHIYGIIQDHRGFLWFGTDAGASRFDGRNFVTYDLRDGLPDEEVLQFFEDSHHRVWMLLLNGKLAFLQNDTLHHPGNDPMLRTASGRSGWAWAAEDSNHRIWFGSVWGELLMLDSLGIFHMIDLLPTGVIGGHVVPLTDRSGKAFIQVNNRGHIVEHGALRYTFSLNTPPAHIVYARSPDGRIWAAAAEGLVEIGEQPRPPAIPVERCGRWELNRSMAFSNEGSLIYARLDHGAVVIDTTAGTARNIFEHESINNVFFDDEGNCWMSTVHEGVLFFAVDQLRSRIVDHIGEEALGAITCLYPGRNGVLWAGTDRGKVLSLKEGDLQEYDLRVGEMRVQKVRALCEDSRSLFATTDLTTARIPLNGPGPIGTVEHWDRQKGLLRNDGPNKMLITLRDGTLVSAYYELMRTTHPNGNALYPFLTQRLGYGRFHLLFEDPERALWIQRNDTLYRWHHGVLDARPDLCTSYGMRASSMGALSDGTLVIGTIGQGLLFLRQGRIVRNLRQADGLISDRCPRIHITGDTIVVASPDGVGLVIVDRPALPDLVVRNLEPITFGVFAADALLLHGDLYVATAMGLHITEELKPRDPPHAPRILLSRITSDELSFLPGEYIKVDHYHSSLTVEVTVISFEQARSTEFQYRVDHGTKWLSSTSNAFSLYTQRAGEHMLEVRARVTGSPWSPVLTTTFVVMPPFWNRSFFRIPVMIALVIGIFLILRYLARRRYQSRMEELRQREALAEERQRIAMDLHDDLGADLSGTALLAEAALQQGKHAPHALADAIARMRDMVAKVDEIIWALDSRNDRLAAIIHHLESDSKLRMKGQHVDFDFTTTRVYTDRVIGSELRRVISLLAKESLNNSLKHAQASAIAMTVMVRDRAITLEIQDNGSGIKLTEGAALRYGLANMRSRAEQVGGTLSITDVRPHGTRVSIELPLPKA